MMGDQELTRQRFLANPFTLQPEDRLYRTFELGRFLPDGNVELVGREQIVAKVWSEILGVEQVGAQDDFFDIGGHSLQAARVINRLQDTFDTDFPLRSFFETPTVEGVAFALSSRLLEAVEDEVLSQTLGEIRQMPDDEVRRVLASQAELSKTGSRNEGE